MQRNGNMKRKCMECALSNTPANVHVVKIRTALSGRAYYHKNTLAAPRPFTRKSLQIFLHECAHFTLHFKSRQKRYIQEYEAEQWSFQKMREAKIPVPADSVKRAKRYISRKIGQAYSRGLLYADAGIREWANT